MPAIVCTRTEEGLVSMTVATRASSLTSDTLSGISTMLRSIRPSPIDFGCTRNGNSGKTEFTITVNGYMSDDAIRTALEQFGRVLSQVTLIDSVDLTLSRQ